MIAGLLSLSTTWTRALDVQSDGVAKRHFAQTGPDLNRRKGARP